MSTTVYTGDPAALKREIFFRGEYAVVYIAFGAYVGGKSAAQAVAAAKAYIGTAWNRARGWRFDSVEIVKPTLGLQSEWKFRLERIGDTANLAHLLETVANVTNGITSLNVAVRVVRENDLGSHARKPIEDEGFFNGLISNWDWNPYDEPGTKTSLGELFEQIGQSGKIVIGGAVAILVLILVLKLT